MNEPTIVFERNGHLYIVGSVAPITPAASDLSEFAFAAELQSQAPNENLLWLRGQYVEAERANRNGQYWSSDEVAIKSLTPRLMPVTVMHDPRTAVGLIADTKLLVPDNDSVPRSRIETALAVWAHRFPGIAEECQFNYEQGTLMQSMECNISHYECTECGKAFVKLPQGAERANWCDHLRNGAANGIPVRRLEGVTFTGTGLIFGTRNGATGALDTAHLQTFENEVAEFHERAHTDRRITRRTSVDDITIKRSEYDELKAEAAKAAELARKVTPLEETAAKVPDLETKVEKLEIDLKTATDLAASEKAQRETLEETARSTTLAGERFGGLGTAFLAKLPDSIKVKLQEQAKTMADEEWASRLEDLEILTGVKPDEQAEESGVVTSDETARTALGTDTSSRTAPSGTQVSSVMGELFRATRRPSAKAGK